MRCGRGPAAVVAARDDATHDVRDAVIVERWQTLRKRRPGPLGRARKAGYPRPHLFRTSGPKKSMVAVAGGGAAPLNVRYAPDSDQSLRSEMTRGP